MVLGIKPKTWYKLRSTLPRPQTLVSGARLALCRSGWLHAAEPPASASQVLSLQLCAPHLATKYNVFMKHLLSSGDLEGGDDANAQTAVTAQVAQAAQRRKCLEILLE